MRVSPPAQKRSSMSLTIPPRTTNPSPDSNNVSPGRQCLKTTDRWAELRYRPPAFAHGVDDHLAAAGVVDSHAVSCVAPFSFAFVRGKDQRGRSYLSIGNDLVSRQPHDGGPRLPRPAGQLLFDEHDRA